MQATGYPTISTIWKDGDCSNVIQTNEIGLQSRNRLIKKAINNLNHKLDDGSLIIQSMMQQNYILQDCI